MTTLRLVSLDDFAHSFVREKTHHSQVRTEELAEAFRRYCGLPRFPSLTDLHKTCRELRIRVSPMPAALSEVDGLNVWSSNDGHAIYLSRKVAVARAEHTLSHELREVIEQAFCRANPNYVGLDTSDNKRMNPESDHFAACLLMHADSSRRRFRELGFDVVAFAEETGRSLSSVVLRAQELFPAKYPSSVAAGIWLFDLPWRQDESHGVHIKELRVAHRAHLGGFSLRKSAKGPPQLARAVFPSRGSTADEFEATSRAFRTREPVLTRVGGFDLFDDHNFIVGAEPLVAGGVPWCIVMTAVRADHELAVRRWLARLGTKVTPEQFQRV